MPPDLLKRRGTEYMHLLMRGQKAYNTIMCLTDWAYLPVQHTILAPHQKMKLITFSVMTLIYYNPHMDTYSMTWHGHKKQIIGP